MQWSSKQSNEASLCPEVQAMASEGIWPMKIIPIREMQVRQECKSWLPEAT
ncbi:MAG: hypothetical protein ACE5IR_18540 [bacterium]